MLFIILLAVIPIWSVAVSFYYIYKLIHAHKEGYAQGIHVYSIDSLFSTLLSAAYVSFVIYLIVTAFKF